MNKYIYLLKIKAGKKITTLLPKSIKPLSAGLKLTEKCNSRCITCNCWKQQIDEKITTKRAIELINYELPKLGIKYLRFTGGEPLLRKDFFVILQHIRMKYKGIILQTNGILIGKFAKLINQSSITSLFVSIDGLKEVNDLIRGIKGDFDLVFENLNYIKKKKITIITTLNRFLANELTELVKYIYSKGYTWNFNLPDRQPLFFKDVEIEKFWPTPSESEKIVDTIRLLKKRYKLNITESQLIYSLEHLKGNVVKSTPCYSGFLKLFIGSQGEVYSGCWVLKPMGNILDTSLLEIVKSPLYIKRVNAMLAGKCPGCTCGYGLNLKISNLWDTVFTYSLS